MKKRYFCALMAAMLLLTGCASLLERSYSSVEPYINRYWDPVAEDTLKAETKQDLVNTLLMLVEQRAEEGEIRYYAEEKVDEIAGEAKREVCEETVPGSYLLESMSFTGEAGEGYYTLTYTMTYRDEAEDMATLMSISDSESLADLLRLAIREGHEKMTARLAYQTSHRADVSAVVEGFWQELCRSYLAEQAPPPVEEELPEDPEQEEQTGDGALLPEDSSEEEPLPETETEPVPEETPAEQPEQEPVEGESEEQPEEPEPAEPEIVCPPCPWEIRFYPDVTYAGVVEIFLSDLPETVLAEVEKEN